MLQFPWFATRLYTVAQRNWIFDTLYQQTSHLVRHLKTGCLSEHLSEELLEDLLYAGLNVPAFSEHQRFRLTHLARPVGQNVACSPLMERWPFEVLNRKKHWEEDVVKVSMHGFLRPGTLTADWDDVQHSTTSQSSSLLLISAQRMIMIPTSSNSRCLWKRRDQLKWQNSNRSWKPHYRMLTLEHPETSTAPATPLELFH